MRANDVLSTHSILPAAVETTQSRKPTCSGRVFDPYFTLVAYFNSLRELGSAQTMLPDRVAREFIGGRYAALSGVEARTIPSIKELTSRKSSQELKQSKHRWAECSEKILLMSW